MSTSSRAYKDAITLLNSLQSNAQTIEAIRKSGGKLNEVALKEMREYLARVGYYPSDLNALNVIHVTGTKGKGSTSAFCDSLLRSLHRNHPPPPSTSPASFKVGLYTSPHLVAVRERIRINGVPLSEERFAKYFFEVWDRLEKNSTVSNPSTPLKPVYFRYLTLLAFHAFKSEKVDTTILEVGVGGAFDSTNIVPRPLTTGITSLGLDHVALLGDTIGEVAWNKAGIFKAGVPALTVEQKEEAMIVLKQRAEEAKASSFAIIPIHPELKTIKLGLSGTHQLSNASLSLALISSLLASPYVPRALSHIPPPPPPPAPGALHAPLEKSLREGLERARWPGRCQLIKDEAKGREGVKWWLDGAHTVESLEGCGKWFWSEVDGRADGVAKKKIGGQEVEGAERILIFNCTNGRSASSLLASLLSQAPSSSSAASPNLNRGFFFDKVIFCTNTTYASGDSKGDLQSRIEDTTLTTQNDISHAFSDLNPAFPVEKIHVVGSIEEAIALVDDGSDSNEGGDTEAGEVAGVRASAQGRGKDVLVTGSLHLVGGVMEVAGLVEVGLRVD